MAFLKLTSTFSDLQIGAPFSPIQGPPALTNVAWPQALNACLFAKGIDALTHWSRDKMANILQTTFSNTLSWMEIYESQ